MSNFLESLQKSFLMTALSRLVMPLLVLAIGWAVTQISSQKEDLALLDVRRQGDLEMTKVLIDAKIALLTQRLEGADRRADTSAESMRLLQSSMAEMRALVAGLAATAQATKEGVDHLRRQVESGALTRRPSGTLERGAD